MANIIFAEQENARLHPPTLKMRQRLQSAPGMGMYMFSDVSCVLICINFIPPSHFTPPEKLLKSPMIAKNLNTPLPSSRKAFGTVNKIISTPAVNPQEKKQLKSQVGMN